MASTAQKKMAIVCLMLVAVGLMLIGMADATTTNECTHCTATVTDRRLPTHECICSKNCACAGKCILEKPGRVQACFIDCVLKNDCICKKNRPCEDKNAVGSAFIAEVDEKGLSDSGSGIPGPENDEKKVENKMGEPASAPEAEATNPVTP